MPMTAQAIVETNDDAEVQLNFKGFMVGNPYNENFENTLGTVRGYYGHGMVAQPVYDRFC